MTEQRIVERVFRWEEVYSGNQLDRAPDLLVTWKEGYVDNCPIGRTNRLISSDFNHLSGGHRMDGRVLEEIFVSGLLQRRSIRYEEAREGLPSSEAGWSPEEAEEIEARLRGLGYL